MNGTVKGFENVLKQYKTLYETMLKIVTEKELGFVQAVMLRN